MCCYCLYSRTSVHPYIRIRRHLTSTPPLTPHQHISINSHLHSSTSNPFTRKIAMSGPYDQYNQGHQQYPQQGQYPPQQHGYDQGGYQQPGYQPQQQAQGYYGDQQQGYQQPSYDQQYGAPAHGGFQHGQQVAPYQQQPQPQQGQYGQQAQYPAQDQYPGQAPQHQFPQQGAYAHDQYPQGQNAYPQPQPGHQPYGSTDPNAQAEGDRGLMGALGGGAAGYFGGNKMGGHGIIGAIAGSILGSKLEDKSKKPKTGNQGGYYH
ncbi:hypothetical protein EJ02DRAFT_501892 [Clathrospora elynae]|uniref:Glycine zipper 2TM domain-containing protein n=1 Tax=Clathrospora elynae TaxID=706981 RepID=A0A6A5T3W5_9PLEO|nr:hypothetical protein EJ02DRAFT_501892 [Clathrospora elynae]